MQNGGERHHHHDNGDDDEAAHNLDDDNDDNVNQGGVSIPHERPSSPPGHTAHPALSRPGELL